LVLTFVPFLTIVDKLILLFKATFCGKIYSTFQQTITITILKIFKSKRKGCF